MTDESNKTDQATESADDRTYREAVASRSTSPYTMGEKIKRIVWNYVGQMLMRFTFHNWYSLRNSLLRAFGATIGRDVRLRSSINVEQPWNLTIGNNSSVGDYVILYCLGKVTIGNDVSISQYAHLCAGTHDYNAPDMPLIRPPIVIEDDVWIAADAFVGPGVTVGKGAVLGARSSAYKDLEPGMVYAGNPARVMKPRIRP